MIETRRPTTFDAAEPWRVNLEDAFNDLVPETLEPQCDPRGPCTVSSSGRWRCSWSQGPRRWCASTSAVRHAPADSIKVCVQLRGRATIHQGGREIVLDPGHLAVYDIARPYALRLEGMWSCAVMAVPRDEIDMPEADLETAMDRIYAAGHGPGLVLAEFVRAAAGQVRSPASSAAVKLGTAGSSLLVGTLIDCDDLAADTAADGLLSHVMAYIRSNLDDPRCPAAASPQPITCLRAPSTACSPKRNTR